MRPLGWELVALAWCVRALGIAAAVLLLAFVALMLAHGFLRVFGRWRTFCALSWLLYGHCGNDPKRLREAVDKWDAWNTDSERKKAIRDAEKAAEFYWRERERNLRLIHELPPLPPEDEAQLDDNEEET